MLNRMFEQLRPAPLIVCSTLIMSCNSSTDLPRNDVVIFDNRVILDIGNDLKGAKPSETEHVVVKRAEGMILIVEMYNSTANPFVLGTVWDGEQAALLGVSLYKNGIHIERCGSPPDWKLRTHTIPPGGSFASKERLSVTWTYGNTLKKGLYRARVSYELGPGAAEDIGTKASLEKWFDLEIVD